MIRIRYDLYEGERFLKSIFFGVTRKELEHEGKRYYDRFKLKTLDDTDLLTAGQKYLEGFFALQLTNTDSFSALKFEWIYDYE